LTARFSQTHISETHSSKASRVVRSIISSNNNAIDKVIEELTQDLKATKGEKLRPSHPCFNLARRFAKKWNISDEAINSHVKLACGYLKFPVIMLLNPAPTHERLPYEQMVAGCATLIWIDDVLLDLGLKLSDIIILDACTLLGKDRIRELERDSPAKRDQAISEAYDVTQRMLEMIKPNVVISCQCSTSWSDWSAGGHLVALEFCSSIKSARAGEVRKVAINDHEINVVQGYHPSGFLNRRYHHDPSGRLLKERLQKMYAPCASWKARRTTTLRSPLQFVDGERKRNELKEENRKVSRTN